MIWLGLNVFHDLLTMERRMSGSFSNILWFGLGVKALSVFHCGSDKTDDITDDDCEAAVGGEERRVTVPSVHPGQLAWQWPDWLLTPHRYSISPNTLIRQTQTNHTNNHQHHQHKYHQHIEHDQLLLPDLKLSARTQTTVAGLYREQNSFTLSVSRQARKSFLSS